MKSGLVLFFLLISALLRADAPRPDPREQISHLRRQIAEHDHRYHRDAAPTISDVEYDRLKGELTTLERVHPELAKTVPSLPPIGDDRSGLFQTAQHRAPMSSLDKAHTPGELRAFHLRLAKALGRDDLVYVVEPKFDGLAVSVTYENGKLVRAVTRGNGIGGDDITANVVQITGLPREMVNTPDAPVPTLIELRGEIYVPLAEFERVNVARELAGEPRFANPRNLAAGTVRQRDARDIAARGLQIVFFAVGACKPASLTPETQRSLRLTIARWGLPTIEELWVTTGEKALLHMVDEVKRTRAMFAYPTDGLVVKLDSFAQQRLAGVGESAPRWAIACKFAPERVETQLRGITLQIGRTGAVTPVAELEPVQLGGSTIARATLHNREEIARQDIRIGDFVYLEKAGDVIPAVAGVNRARRPAGAEPFVFPIACPECFARLMNSEMEVAVRCLNEACPAQVRRRIEHFASKGCTDIEGLGPATIATLVGAGWVKDIPDLYRLNRATLLTLGKNNEKSVDRLLAAIAASRKTELWRIIHGLGVPHVGAATAKDLARQCGSLAALAEHGPKAATALAEPRYQGLIAELIAIGFDAATMTNGVRSLEGKVFVLTGTLPTLTRRQATERIEMAGGRVASSVSRAADYLVAGAEPGAKLAQAQILDVVVIDEAEMLRLIEAK